MLVEQNLARLSMVQLGLAEKILIHFLIQVKQDEVRLEDVRSG
jgi:hypothetical protein